MLRHVADHILHGPAVRLAERVHSESTVQAVHHARLQGAIGLQQGHELAGDFLVVGVNDGLPLREFPAALANLLYQRVESRLPF